MLENLFSLNSPIGFTPNNPEKLESLLPAFPDRIPGDFFADRPLQYLPNPKGGYKLWSVGWDEKDDGGGFVQDENGQARYGEEPGDWVWEFPRRQGKGIAF